MTEKKEEFFPVGYKVPDKKKQFMKFKQGENPYRILSAPLLGWMFFDKNNKPIVRQFSEGQYTENELIELDAKPDEDGSYSSRHFWALLVWDYSSNSPKILNITQLSIQLELRILDKSDKWGDLRKYDLVTTREGTGKNDTKYNTMPEPPTELIPEIQQCLKELEENNLLDLNAIWAGKYPFKIYNW